MKIYLQFNSENIEDMERYERIMAAERMAQTLFQIRNEIFRPARKHGYSDKLLNKLLENSDCAHLIEILESKFNEICEENDTLDFT